MAFNFQTFGTGTQPIRPSGQFDFDGFGAPPEEIVKKKKELDGFGSFIDRSIAPYVEKQKGVIERSRSGEQTTFETATQSVGNAINAFFAPVVEASMPILNKAVNPLTQKPLLQELGTNIQKTGEALTNIPLYQKLAQQTTERTDANIEALNSLLQVVPLPSSSIVAKSIANQAFDAAGRFPSTWGGGSGALVKRAEQATIKEAGQLERSIPKQIERVFPVLKKDVGNLEQKVQKAQTAFTDIVENRNKIDVQDSLGKQKPVSEFTFTDTVTAQQQRLKQIFEDYTKKLAPVDKTAFDEGIYKLIFDESDAIKAKLAKENSRTARQALTSIYKELNSLRDTSPIGIQNYLQRLNQETKAIAPGGALTVKQIEQINLAGRLRDSLDDFVEKFGGEGYKETRQVYAGHKAIQSQLLQAAKSELNKTPGWTDRIANIGMTAEGINYLLTQNPKSIAIGLGIKGATEFQKWLASPQRALQDVFRNIERVQRIKPKPLSPQAINTNANNVNMSPIDNSLPVAQKLKAEWDKIK